MNILCTKLLAGATLALLATATAQANEVNVYTYRETQLIQPLLDAFTKDTGIKTNVVAASSGLEQRIRAEGANSPADVLLTVDIGRLQEATDLGITQPVKSVVLEKAIPAQYRDPNGHWFGISMRARVVYASKERVKQDAITYEELADPKWKGKICIRSGQHIYNNALFAVLAIPVLNENGQGRPPVHLGECHGGLCLHTGPALERLGVDDPFVGHNLAVLAVKGHLGAIVGDHHEAPGAANTEIDLGDPHFSAVPAPPAPHQLRGRPSPVD